MLCNIDWLRERKRAREWDERRRYWESVFELCWVCRAELEGLESSHIRHGGWLQGQTQYCGEWPCYHTALHSLHCLHSKTAKQGWKTTKNRCPIRTAPKALMELAVKESLHNPPSQKATKCADSICNPRPIYWKWVLGQFSGAVKKLHKQTAQKIPSSVLFSLLVKQIFAPFRHSW